MIFEVHENVGVSRRSPDDVAIVAAAVFREVNLQRGFLRLGAAFVLLWFIFWTCAYVVSSRPSENAPVPAALSPTTELVLIASGVLFIPWIVSGFRPD